MALVIDCPEAETTQSNNTSVASHFVILAEQDWLVLVGVLVEAMVWGVNGSTFILVQGFGATARGGGRFSALIPLNQVSAMRS